MKNRTNIVAGTALALVMAAGAVAAAPLPFPSAPPVAGAPDRPLVLAQAADDEELSEEERLRRQQEEQEAPAEEAPAEQPPAEAPPAEEPPAEEAPAPVEEPPVEEQAPAEVTPEEAPAPEMREEAPAEEAPAEEAPAEQPPAEELPAEEPPAEDVPVPQEAPAEPAPADEAPAPEAPAAPEQPAEDPAQAPQTDEPAAPVPSEGPIQQTPQEQQPTEEGPLQPSPQEPAPAQPGAAPETGDAPAPAEETVAPEGEAPILDSQKEGEGEAPAPTDGEAQAPAPAPEDAGPPPTTDAEAQQLDTPVEVQSLRAEEGRRIDRRDERFERREGSDVLREFGDRIILQFNNQTIVRSDDRERLGRDAAEVYYEELPRGRTRETIVRENGVQVVTIRDRYGDIVRRSRITPDGHEYVLVYGDDRSREERRDWRDPGRDLPPLRLTIPRDEYILDARRAQEPEDYYDFFEQPPVERVRRLYTVDEVKYSARVRDSVRRVDLDTITFEFGAASIAESEISRLDGVASAMERLLENNPAETFLIEGHTDAVGSDQANLALSDRRAEAVAVALTNVFGIPPENLVTQGYGERYLKVNTQEPERENRRVAIRRITPLVSPVASR